MPLELYTPGHNLVTDSLIMHGIVRYLIWAGARHGSVERIGERFKIIINDDINEDKAISELVRLQRQCISTVNLGEPVGLFLRKVWASNVNEQKQIFSAWVNSLSQSITTFKSIKINIYKDVNHIVKNNEGRKPSKAKSRRKSSRVDSVDLPVYLPLGPIYGKYLSKDYVAKENIQYRVCPACFLMANMGLVYGTFILRVNKVNKVSSIMVTLIPSSKADLIDIMLIQRAFEYNYREFNIDIPILAAPLIALSFGETLYAFENMDALIWIYERSGIFMRIPNYIQVNIEELLKAISGIKYYIPQWPKILNDCLLENEDGSIILAELSEIIINNMVKDNIYSITREITKFLKDKKTCVMYLNVIKSLVNALAEL
ncbi:hypothetical protein [Vulcanisaeta sp. JCM 16159]|uniref:hypothetical protein n=1 Tax=Vulcanisaeta sp. JCM 16159 TaxID=1295371 RepID=UPI0006CFC6A2|nr:hypothetical protein [Vulcanisaeta sp. JCM 16159]